MLPIYKIFKRFLDTYWCSMLNNCNVLDITSDITVHKSQLRFNYNVYYYVKNLRLKDILNYACYYLYFYYPK